MTCDARNLNPLASLVFPNKECVKSKKGMNNGITKIVVDGFKSDLDMNNGMMKLLRDGFKYKLNMNNGVMKIFGDGFTITFSDEELPYFTFNSDALLSALKRKCSTPKHFSGTKQEIAEILQFVIQQTGLKGLKLKLLYGMQMWLQASAIQTGFRKKLKAKDEEIARIEKQNRILQKRVNKQSVENQRMCDRAKTIESTANNLESKLELILAQFNDSSSAKDALICALIDVESKRGSCDWNKVTVVTGKCRLCGVRRAVVLALPCQHLCVCKVCGSPRIKACPVCDNDVKASTLVNILT